MKTAENTKFSLEKIRLLYKHLSENGDLDNFRDILTDSELDDDSNLVGLIRSLQKSYIRIDEFINGDYLKNNNLYYSSEDYVITREGDLENRDDCNFCDYFQEYTTEDMFNVHLGRSSKYFCESAVNRYSRREENLYEYCNEYYDSEAMERYDLCLTEDTNEVMSTDDAFYSDEDGCWYSEEQEKYLRGYHDSNVSSEPVTFSEEPKFFIGFEIEKEDQDVKQSIVIRDFEKSCKGWKKERDGSLSDKSGFELISPCYELDSKKISEDIKNNEIILNHINAKHNTDTCGGHINISQKDLSGSELFEKIQGYTPLIHALYYKRIDKRFSKGKSNKDLKVENEKYQSVKIHANRVEYRIVSAVPNFDTLMWRSKLFEIILNNQTSSVTEGFFKCFTVLKSHLEEMYPTKEAFDKLINRVVDFTANYEGVNLDYKKDSE